MEYNGILEKKIRLLEGRLEEIEDWNIKDYSEFKNSSLHINAVERALTVCVQIMIDVSERILAINKKPPKNTALENLEQIEQLGVIKSAKDYSPMIKFRNLVVHRYEDIDPDILFNIITNNLDDYRQYIHEVRTYCSRPIENLNL